MFEYTWKLWMLMSTWFYFSWKWEKLWAPRFVSKSVFGWVHSAEGFLLVYSQANTGISRKLDKTIIYLFYEISVYLPWGQSTRTRHWQISKNRPTYFYFFYCRTRTTIYVDFLFPNDRRFSFSNRYTVYTNHDQYVVYQDQPKTNSYQFWYAIEKTFCIQSLNSPQHSTYWLNLQSIQNRQHE